jgi:uncharacterized protein with HEPN domain
VRSDLDRVRDILEAIERIERHTGAGREAFDNDELIQVWVVRHLQIIGGAASRLSQDARDQHPAVPWRKIIGMRHILVHGYFEVDLNLVWSVVDHELTALRSAIAPMAREPGTPSASGPGAAGGHAPIWRVGHGATCVSALAPARGVRPRVSRGSPHGPYSSRPRHSSIRGRSHIGCRSQIGRLLCETPQFDCYSCCRLPPH